MQGHAVRNFTPLLKVIAMLHTWHRCITVSDYLDPHHFPHTICFLGGAVCVVGFWFTNKVCRFRGVLCFDIQP